MSEKQIPFNIKEIMEQTATEYVGKQVNQYAEVYVATFYINKKEYALYTIIDLDTEYRNLVVVNENLTIINKMED